MIILIKTKLVIIMIIICVNYRKKMRIQYAVLYNMHPQL